MEFRGEPGFMRGAQLIEQFSIVVVTIMCFRFYVFLLRFSFTLFMKGRRRVALHSLMTFTFSNYFRIIMSTFGHFKQLHHVSQRHWREFRLAIRTCWWHVIQYAKIMQIVVDSITIYDENTKQFFHSAWNVLTWCLGAIFKLDHMRLLLFFNLEKMSVSLLPKEFFSSFHASDVIKIFLIFFWKVSGIEDLCDRATAVINITAMEWWTPDHSQNKPRRRMEQEGKQKRIIWWHMILLPT